MRDLNVRTNLIAVGDKPAKLTKLVASDNGTYTPTYPIEGYDEVEVEIPEPAPVILESLTATENGTYDPEDYMADGFSEVTVNVVNTQNAPMLLDFDYKLGKDASTTRTTKTFSAKKGNKLLIGISHRSSLTIPTGFTVLDESGNFGGQFLTILVKQYDSDTNESITITQASSVRLDYIAALLPDIELSSISEMKSSSNSMMSNFVLTLSQKPFICFISNIYYPQYTGTTCIASWPGIDSTLFQDLGIITANKTTRFLTAVLNFGTLIPISSSFQRIFDFDSDTQYACIAIQLGN